MSQTNDALRYALIAIGILLIGSIGIGIAASDAMHVTSGFCAVQEWQSGQEFADRFVNYYVHEGYSAPVLSDIANLSAKATNAIKCMPY